MKNRFSLSVLSLMLFCIFNSVNAQEPFKMEYKFQFPISVESRFITEDRTLVLAGTNSEIAMMDAATGKLLWQLNIKQKLGQKKAKDWSLDQKVNVAWVDVKGDKKDELITHYYKGTTGEEITAAQYQALKDAYNENWRWVKKGTLVVKSHATDVWIEYEKKRFAGSVNKGSKGKLTIKASGDNTWSTVIDAKYTTTLCYNAIPRAAKDYGGDFLRLAYAQDKIFVIYEGLSVIDIKTGKLLWQTDLDNTDFDFGVFKSVQTLGRAGYPFADETGVYVADLSKKQHRIKKFDLNTGVMIWQSEEFENDDVVPNLEVVGGVLMAQFGGRLETQSFIPGVEGRPDVCKTEYKFAGNAGLRAYDISTGKILWETNKMKELGDKFSGAITNLLVLDETAFIASDKNVYAFDVNGKVKFSVPIKSLKIGKPTYIELYKDGSLRLLCEDGVASINPADGKVNFATNTGACLMWDDMGNAFYVWTGKDQFNLEEFVRVDMANGKILGKMKNAPYPFFTPDGEYIITFDGARVMRFKTK